MTLCKKKKIIKIIIFRNKGSNHSLSLNCLQEIFQENLVLGEKIYEFMLFHNEKNVIDFETFIRCGNNWMRKILIVNFS